MSDHRHAQLIPLQLDQLDGNDLHYLRKLIRRDLRLEHKGIRRAEESDRTGRLDREVYLARRRAKIGYADSVLVKLGGDPTLFWEPEPSSGTGRQLS
jgi:hypothetical protein